MTETPPVIHSFDAAHAARFGIAEAVLIRNLAFWIAKNQEAGRNAHDGRTWTHNTPHAMAEAYPYLSKDQVRYALRKLVKAGVLVTGNYNRMGMDRTLWYAFSDDWAHLVKSPDASGKSAGCIGQNRQMHEADSPDALGKSASPIPDRNPVPNPDGNPDERERAPEASSNGPQLADVIAVGGMSGVRPDAAERFFYYYDAMGWTVSGHPIRNWQSKLMQWKIDEPKMNRKNKRDSADRNGSLPSLSDQAL